jgi:hypothetical protein
MADQDLSDIARRRASVAGEISATEMRDRVVRHVHSGSKSQITS